MPPDLSSANWKIDRAVELLSGLDTEVAAWHDKKPYSIFTYVNPEKTRATVNVREHHPPDKIRWSLMVADIVHNLRCALDHTFWALLQDEFPSGLPPKTDRLSFPIWSAPPNADQRRNFQPLSPKFLAAIESVQPYSRPDNRFPVHPLAIIRDIDNGNKHKLLLTVMPSLAKVDVKVSGLRHPHQPGVHEIMYRGELKDGVEAVVTTFDVPEPYMKYECTMCMSIIAIKHPVANRLGQDRDDYAALIDTLIVEVREVIAALAASMA